MFFECQLDKEQLIAGLTTVERGMALKDKLSPLAGILLEISGQIVTLTTSNNEVFIQTQVPVITGHESAVVVDGKLALLARRLPGNTVFLRLRDNQMVVEAESSQYHLHALSADEFPAIPTKQKLLFSVPARQLVQMIMQTSFATGEDDTRPYLSGCLVELSDGRLKLVATDSSRLAYCDYVLDPAEMGSNGHASNQDLSAEDSSAVQERKAYLIPQKSLVNVMRVLLAQDKLDTTSVEEAETGKPASTEQTGQTAQAEPVQEKKVHIYEADGQVIAAYGSTLLSSRLIDSAYPNYPALFPGEQPIRMQLNRKDFQSAIERASILNSRGASPVLLILEDGILTVSAQTGQGEQFTEQLEVEQQGESGRSLFSGQYMLDFLKTVAEEQIEFHFNEDYRQSLMKPVGRDDYLYVIMPYDAG